MAANDEYMLNIGKQCSHNTCNLVDFLPFKCQHCSQSYCGDHFLPQTHQCERYDENKHNRVAPPCPFCQTPIAIPVGEDPNVRMERHFNTDCAVLVGKPVKPSTPRCPRANCGKVLFAPIKCDTCKQQFCPTHRFPADHRCVTLPAAKPSSPANGAASRPGPSGAAAMAAIKRAVNTTTSSSSASRPAPPSPQKRPQPPASPSKPIATSTSTKSTSSSTARPTNPFSATDRRAKAERESRLKGMEARAKKGLLSEEEKVLLAAAKAEEASKKDCVIA
ncbi:hypothetical protein BXZ70DRAFT_1005247 [Cristinia sonorae]|uniref:AN1-type domain-containing protein n=1 Tax=Cristinia sonorae TaxID=1940300 RepID=A0A8K0UWZ8_9AGAR|nr:hypothetical protein BXZ70DRAFT_1005247 [Cristinia sonorae]